MTRTAEEFGLFLQTPCKDLKHGAEVRQVLLALCDAAVALSDTISKGSLAGDMAKATAQEGGGDVQKFLDLHSNQVLHDCLKGQPVAWFASEEDPEPVAVTAGAPLALAVDPLDGSSNIDTNAAIGTIFSIRAADKGAASFLEPGTGQLAAGFVVYGPQTVLVFTLGCGTHMATLDRSTGKFFVTARKVMVDATCREYAINMSNKRHWSDGIRTYVQDCQRGIMGPRGVDFNMRWIASLVADAYRILVRGGIYLYPSDTRKGYEQGRLRLVYEAFPIAMIMEQAGGKATDGHIRILEKSAEQIHARTPLVFGSADEVLRLTAYLENTDSLPENAPLFGERGLFRN
ncbi:MAG TPA: class 1 fructose-bisphosphatase [Aestuariivirga sp.]|nr:class 1 fructose-bisphosphatase [Aestuariivirga sp.]